MSRKKLTFAAMLTVIGLSGTTHAETLTPAQQSALDQRTSCMTRRSEARLLRLDTNKDGTIDRAERKAARAARKQEMLAQYDSDGDGKLSPAERQQLRHDRLVARFEALDSNGDAEISAAEAKVACGRFNQRFARADVDHNGSVTWTEFEGAAKRHKGRLHGHGRHGKGTWGKGHGERSKGEPGQQGQGQRWRHHGQQRSVGGQDA